MKCPICGMTIGETWGGTTPCRAPWAGPLESHVANQASLKKRGCIVLAESSK